MDAKTIRAIEEVAYDNALNPLRTYNRILKVIENIKEEKSSYDKIIDGITAIDVEEYNINGVIPEKILKICDYNSEKKCFVSKKYKIQLGNIYDIVDKTFEVNDEE